MTEPGGWNFTARGRRDMRKLDRPVQRRVIEALDRLVGEPPQGDVAKLAGIEDEWRLRVGDWRVRFTRDGWRATVGLVAGCLVDSTAEAPDCRGLDMADALAADTPIGSDVFQGELGSSPAHEDELLVAVRQQVEVASEKTLFDGPRVMFATRTCVCSCGSPARLERWRKAAPTNPLPGTSCAPAWPRRATAAWRSM